jgi:SPP1 family predicted phage head-tail adaptor
MRVEVVRLIAESPASHGVFEPAQESGRPVYCEVKSVSQTETYQARATGLSPEYRLELGHRFDYQGEKKCVMGGVCYDVIRTYEPDGDTIELTIQRTEGNADVQ